ncbi:recombinase, partial [Klebsiella pneumoniae]
MRKSESIKNIALALSKFQSEVENPKNTADNPYYKSKYAPLQDVLNTVRPLLSKHGLSIVQSPSGDGERISIHTMLIHESGEWIEFDPLVLKAEKITPQGAGSAITYGRRYSLSAVLGISSEDDDDVPGLKQRLNDDYRIP